MDRFPIQAKPVAVNMVYQKEDLRLTLLTPCLLRLEKGSFTDLPTQTVWNRDLGVIPFSVEEKEDICTIRTEEAAFCVDISQGKLNSVTLLNGSIAVRPACMDQYYFAYGHDYRSQLKDFFRLSGPVPLRGSIQ